MKTLKELELLEALAHETGLRHEELQIEFDERTRHKPTPTLLAQQGAGEESTAQQYCDAISDFLNEVIDERRLWSIMSARRIIN